MMRLTSWRGRIAFIAGVFVSAVWAWFFIGYVGREYGWANVGDLALPDQARLVTGR
jgi:hypothetical protein